MNGYMNWYCESLKTLHGYDFSKQHATKQTSKHIFTVFIDEIISVDDSFDPFYKYINYVVYKLYNLVCIKLSTTTITMPMSAILASLRKTYVHTHECKNMSKPTCKLHRHRKPCFWPLSLQTHSLPSA